MQIKRTLGIQETSQTLSLCCVQGVIYIADNSMNKYIKKEMYQRFT